MVDPYNREILVSNSIEAGGVSLSKALPIVQVKKIVAQS